ncbi:hypothetical protein N0V95_002071 [Ascochyta clinopodiicola]|nr:hypothetical protein N0V95_002071 [Ascochyta clinopodiicola]
MGTSRAEGTERRNVGILIPRMFHLKHIDDHSFDHTIRDQLKADKKLATWSTKPRLYTLLRMLQQDPEFDTATFRLEHWAQANDLWLPLPQAVLEKFVLNLNLNLNPDRLNHIKRLQACVLSSPPGESEGELRTGLKSPVHRHIESGDLFFDKKTELDHGASARVYRVRYKGTRNVSACKEYPRGTFMQQRTNFPLFATELAILRRLKHPHIVKLVASFTDESVFAIIMDPAADTSLGIWFEDVSTPIAQDEYDTLQRSFGCLMSALTYLHGENVRHKDIKPSNILLKGGKIYLCDFGISYDWTGENPITNNWSTPRTEGYCAPEVMEKGEKGVPSDVWSMARVFCDIITIKQGRSLEDMLSHIGGDMSCIYDDGKIEKMMEWLINITGNTHQRLLDWTSRMIYESYLETDQNPSDIWLRTRRLVISINFERPGYQRCSDIWLPLADLCFTQNKTNLTIQWSDCTRWTKRSTGNYDFDCDQAYIPETPNREITISFHDMASAQRFVETLRILYVDAKSQNQKELSIGDQGLHISDMRQGEHVRYRVVSLTSREGQSVSSKLFVHKPIIDFNILTTLDPVTSEEQTTIEFDKVRSPHYISSVVRKPNQDSTKVGRCAGVKLKMSAYKVRLPPGPAIATSAISMGKPD